jgi:hypothetical protein
LILSSITEIQEFVSGEQHIYISFGILASAKLSHKSLDTELKVLKSYTTDLPSVTNLAAAEKMISARVDSMADCILSC